MALKSRIPFAADPASPRFWFVMSMGLLVGFIFAYPMNWWLVAYHLKHGMMTVRPAGAAAGAHTGMDAAEHAGMDAAAHASPTMSMGPTQAGMILGTAAYMAPEPARGKAVDKRADIWAFGVVLYEMLTGRRLFQGETVSDTLAAVLKQDPEWERAPAQARRPPAWRLRASS